MTLGRMLSIPVMENSCLGELVADADEDDDPEDLLVASKWTRLYLQMGCVPGRIVGVRLMPVDDMDVVVDVLPLRQP